MIRLARTEDIEQISNGYAELFAYEEKHGSNTNWKAGVYPTSAVPLAHLPTGNLYVLEQAGAICASMVLDSSHAPEYRQIDWKYPAAPEKVLVIHTLCVPPRFAGHGYATKMVKFAMNFAQNNGFEVIRIDTWEHNEPAKALYIKQGFRQAGFANAVHQGLYETRLVYLEWQAQL